MAVFRKRDLCDFCENMQVDVRLGTTMVVFILFVFFLAELITAIAN